MTDRPILFSGPMVRALLAGTKTQTRRVAKVKAGVTIADISEWIEEPSGFRRGVFQREQIAEPRFAVGDRLYVRERVACGECAPGKPSHWSPSFWRREQGTSKNPNGIWYEADGLTPEIQITERGRWAQGMHMPRWASRITLIVSGVLVQRLQDISCADAIAEGISPAANSQTVDCDTPDPRDGYRALWDSLNAARGFGWNSNPWVVAVSFTVEHRNIDAMAAA